MDNKKIKIVSIISIIALALTLVAATYAYFVAQTGEGAQTDVKINANTVDTFTFEVGSALNLSLNQENFASGKGNQTGTTFAKAMLSANNKTNTATEHYYLYLNISNNTFTYSIDNNTPEILLSIKDGSNNEITTLTGLTYKTVTDGKGASIKGFDITNKKGLITILNNREITTTSTKTEEWNVTVTFVNYNSNQAGNAGKSFNAKLMIQKEEYKLPTLAEYVKSQYTGTQGANNIYYHDASLTNGAGDNSYRFAGASDAVNNYVCFGSSTTPCPADNLYRIIGVFGDKVKLIKSTSVGNKTWDSNTKNTWSTSSLNTYLNNEFINTFDETTKGKIADTTWKVGGNKNDNISKQPAKIAYQNEVVKPVPGSTSNGETEHPAKIGLMYASDYGFAAAQSAWTTNLYDYDGAAIKSANWMYLGSHEWTISRNADYSNSAFNVNKSGFVAGYDNFNLVTIAHGVRPVFSLTSSVNYASGSGSATDPILVN